MERPLQEHGSAPEESHGFFNSLLLGTGEQETLRRELYDGLMAWNTAAAFRNFARLHLLPHQSSASCSVSVFVKNLLHFAMV